MACAQQRVCMWVCRRRIQFSFSINWNLSSLAFMRSSERSDVKRIDCLSCWALRQHQQHYAPCAHLIYTIHFKCDTTHIHHSGTHSCGDARICATLSFRSVRFSTILFYLFFAFRFRFDLIVRCVGKQVAAPKIFSISENKGNPLPLYNILRVFPQRHTEKWRRRRRVYYVRIEWKPKFSHVKRSLFPRFRTFLCYLVSLILTLNVLWLHWVCVYYCTLIIGMAFNPFRSNEKR